MNKNLVHIAKQRNRILGVVDAHPEVLQGDVAAFINFVDDVMAKFMSKWNEYFKWAFSYMNRGLLPLSRCKSIQLELKEIREFTNNMMKILTFFVGKGDGNGDSFTSELGTPPFLFMMLDGTRNYMFSEWQSIKLQELITPKDCFRWVNARWLCYIGEEGRDTTMDGDAAELRRKIQSALASIDMYLTTMRDALNQNKGRMVLDVKSYIDFVNDVKATMQQRLTSTLNDNGLREVCCVLAFVEQSCREFIGETEETFDDVPVLTDMIQSNRRTFTALDIARLAGACFTGIPYLMNRWTQVFPSPRIRIEREYASVSDEDMQHAMAEIYSSSSSSSPSRLPSQVSFLRRNAAYGPALNHLYRNYSMMTTPSSQRQLQRQSREYYHTRAAHNTPAQQSGNEEDVLDLDFRNMNIGTAQRVAENILHDANQSRAVLDTVENDGNSQPHPASSVPTRLIRLREVTLINPYPHRSVYSGGTYNDNMQRVHNTRASASYQYRFAGSWVKTKLKTGGDDDDDDEPLTIDWQQLRLAFDEYSKAWHEFEQFLSKMGRIFDSVDLESSDIHSYHILVLRIQEALFYEFITSKELFFSVMKKEKEKEAKGDFTTTGRNVDLINNFMDKTEELLQLCKGIRFFLDEALPSMRYFDTDRFSIIETHLAMPGWHHLQVVVRCAAQEHRGPVDDMFRHEQEYSRDDLDVPNTTNNNQAGAGGVTRRREQMAAPRRVLPRRGGGGGRGRGGDGGGDDDGRTTNASEDRE